MSAVIDYKMHFTCGPFAARSLTCVCVCYSFSDACFHECPEGPDGGVRAGRADSLQRSGPAAAGPHLEQGERVKRRQVQVQRSGGQVNQTERVLTLKPDAESLCKTQTSVSLHKHAPRA